MISAIEHGRKSGNGVSSEKEGDPRFQTGASPMCGPRENNGVGLRRKHRRLIWFFWMKVESTSIWPGVMAGEKAGGEWSITHR